MKTSFLEELIEPAGSKAGSDTAHPVYSVTKHNGFVPSAEYFKKQIFSRELTGYKRVLPGDFAYATIHLDEGSIGIAPADGLISPMYTVFRPNVDRVDPTYLLRYMKSPAALAQYPRFGKGSVHRRKSISLTALGKLIIPMPSIEEQRRIAAILDKADALRAIRRQSDSYFDSLPQSMFLDMFGTQTKSGAFDSVVLFMRNGLSPSKGGSVAATVLTLSAVTQGRFDASAAKVSTFVDTPGANVRVSADDFLICRGNGNRALVGVGVHPSERSDLVFPDTVIAARIDKTKIDPAYLEVAWNLPAVRRQIETAARTTNGTHKVNQKSLGAVEIPLPLPEEQREFALRVASIPRPRSTELDELLVSLPSRAFSGRL
jgi:type I restriction enzyme, S subunit